MAAGDDTDRAIRALRTGSPVPEAGRPALSGLLTALNHLEPGAHPPHGWLSVIMVANDVARRLLDRQGTPTHDTDKAAALLREGTPFPAESGPEVARLLEKLRELSPTSETPSNWGAELNDAASALVQAIMDDMAVRKV